MAERKQSQEARELARARCLAVLAEVAPEVVTSLFSDVWPKYNRLYGTVLPLGGEAGSEEHITETRIEILAESLHLPPFDHGPIHFESGQFMKSWTAWVDRWGLWEHWQQRHAMSQLAQWMLSPPDPTNPELSWASYSHGVSHGLEPPKPDHWRPGSGIDRESYIDAFVVRLRNYMSAVEGAQRRGDDADRRLRVWVRSQVEGQSYSDIVDLEFPTFETTSAVGKAVRYTHDQLAIPPARRRSARRPAKG